MILPLNAVKSFFVFSHGQKITSAINLRFAFKYVDKYKRKLYSNVNKCLCHCLEAAIMMKYHYYILKTRRQQNDT